jgi:riboflavin synthase
MFTGIVEEVGTVLEVRRHQGNLDLVVRAHMASEVRVDQSIAHNGVCLTVVGHAGTEDLPEASYRVTVVEASLQRSHLGSLVPGDGVNLERCLAIGDRLDGHWVQGHVDEMAECLDRRFLAGSWRYVFALPSQPQLLVAQGSVCINGVSLTIAELTGNHFTVAIIPYTYANTTFHALRPSGKVNLEYDVLGKYVERMLRSGK